MSMLRSWAAAALAAAVAALMAACGGGGDAATASDHTESAATADHRGHDSDRGMSVQLSVLSSAPQFVSGGDARIHVRAPRGLRDKLELRLNGRPVDIALEEVADGLEGVVSGLRLGDNRLEVKHRHAHVRDGITLTNWPITGPMFTGPQQTPFVCTATQFNLQPNVDSRHGPGLPGDGCPGTDHRLQPELLDRHVRHLPVPSNQQQLEDAAGRAAARRHDDGDVARRAHGRFRHPARGGVDQPLPVQLCDAGPGGREPRAAGSQPVEPQAALLVPGWRGDRAHPGQRAQWLAEPRHPAPGLGHRAQQRQQHRHALQPQPGRRDGHDDQGALHRALRRAAVHRGPGRLGWCDPAVHHRAEPSWRARWPAARAELPRHGDADHSRGRLRTARVLHGRHRSHQCEVAHHQEPQLAGRLQRRRRPARYPGLGGQRSVRAAQAVARLQHGDRQHRVRAGLARADAAGDEPAVRPGAQRAVLRAASRHPVDPLDTLRRPAQRVWRGRHRRRARHLGQRRRAVRPAFAQRGQDHAGRVPAPELEHRWLEASEPDGAGDIPLLRHRRERNPEGAHHPRLLRPLEQQEHADECQCRPARAAQQG